MNIYIYTYIYGDYLCLYNIAGYKYDISIAIIKQKQTLFPYHYNIDMYVCVTSMYVLQPLIN